MHPSVGPPLPRVTSVDLDGLVTVFSPLLGTALFLNPTATAVWRLSDGTRTVAALVAELAAAYAVPEQELRGEVEPLLASFAESGLIAPVQ